MKNIELYSIGLDTIEYKDIKEINGGGSIFSSGSEMAEDIVNLFVKLGKAIKGAYEKGYNEGYNSVSQ